MQSKQREESNSRKNAHKSTENTHYPYQGEKEAITLDFADIKTIRD